MVRREVLAALADGIAAGDEDAARAAILRTEWLLRAHATRRLERALLAATLASGETDSSHDPEAARHIQRIAALDLARVRSRSVRAPMDRARTAEAYAGLPPVSRRRIPISTRLGLVAIIITAIAGVCSIRETSPGPVDGHIKPLPPPAIAAFQDGGRPFGDPALEELLVGDFTDLQIAASHTRSSDERVRVRLEAVARAPAIVGRGATLAAAWADMIDVLARIAVVPTGAELDSLARELHTRVYAVSEQFAEAGIGLHLTGHVRSRNGRAHVNIYTYRVEQVVFVDVDGESVRTLSLRRIDRLRRSWAALGMQSDEFGDPVVLLDKIEKYTATVVMPLLAADAPYPFGGWDEGGLAAAVGLAVRDELLAALGDDASAAGEIGGLLAERTQIVDGWYDQLNDPPLTRTGDLYLASDTLNALVDRVDAHQHRRVRELEDRLHQLEAARIAERVNDLIAATVRRHEAQHAVDGERDEPLHLLASGLDRDGPPRRPPGRAASELAAYLSQIANDIKTPRLSLWHATRPAFDQTMWGSAESYAAVVIVEGLARHLGVNVELPAMHGDAIVRARLLASATALANASGEQLRAAAHALWREHFDEPLLPIQDLANDAQ